MKLIRQASLAFKQGKSDKVYEVDLCQVGDDQYVVNFRFGRRGSTLKDGSKTVLPVSKDKAENIFNDLVNSKKKKGYWDAGQGAPADTAPPSRDEGGIPKRKETVLAQLRAAVREEPGGTKRPLDRLIWRAGEMRLKQAATILLELAGTSEPMTNYCLAWSLGRCGDETAMPFLRDLYMNNDNPEHIRRIAMESYRFLCSPSSKETFQKGIAHGLPKEIRTAYFEGPQDVFESALEKFLKKAPPDNFEVLNDIYLLDSDRARTSLIKLLETAPLKPKYFKRFRRLLKAAELRCDGQIYGLLIHRMEKQKHYTTQSEWGDYGHAGGHYINNIKKELKKPNSRAAYTQKTRDYLRRRAWRFLKRMGELDDDAYVRMAAGILLQVTDEDGVEPYMAGYYWDSSTRTSATLWCDKFGIFHAFNHILYGNSPRYRPKEGNRLGWLCQPDYKPGEPAPAAREEAFPHLWDKHPNGLLHLLSDSRCIAVHEFAVKALRANPSFCESLDAEIIKMMLAAPYNITHRLAVELAEKKFDPASPDVALVTALLSCSLDDARNLAISWLNQHRAAFVPHTDFWVTICLVPFEDVRKTARDALTRISFMPDQAQTLLNRFLDQMMLFSDEADLDLAAELGETVRLAFSPLLRQLDMAVVLKLLDHPFPTVQAFAGHILMDHSTPVELLPESVLRKLIDSTDERARSVGVQLFGKLPATSLMTKQEVVISFCISPHTDVRQAVRPMLDKLVTYNSEFGRLLAQALVYHLLKKEPSEGFYRDITGTLTGVLSGSLTSIDKGLTVRLLKSRSTLVQAFGGFVLRQRFKSHDFSVREIMTLLDTDVADIRDLGRQWCRDEMFRLRQEIPDTVRMFDSKWDDTREFAFTFFRENFGPEVLTPEVMVGICDSVRPEVQQFGCELVTKYFLEENGPEYMVKLSQHPSSNLQLFVTNYLARYAAGSPERIRELVDYFIIVLSQVNKARVARQRIFAFFREEALKNKEIAETVTQIITRISLTMAIQDKARCIELLRDINREYPEITVPVAVQPVNVRQGGSSHAV